MIKRYFRLKAGLKEKTAEKRATETSRHARINQFFCAAISPAFVYIFR